MRNIAIFFILSLLKNVHSKSLTIEVPHDDVEALSFRLIHVNDIHAHFEEVSAELGRCQKDKPCYGGAARMATKVIELRYGQYFYLQNIFQILP